MADRYSYDYHWTRAVLRCQNCNTEYKTEELNHRVPTDTRCVCENPSCAALMNPRIVAARKAQQTLLERELKRRYGQGGFKASKPGIVYYIRINVPGMAPLYKIGITNRTVDERFRSEDLQFITKLEHWRYANGAKAREHEAEVLREHKAWIYTGPKLLKSNGDTELFTRDVLGLDVTPDASCSPS